MNLKEIFIISILLLVLVTGCTPEITKDDLKVTDIIWLQVEIENEMKSFARIEAEAYKTPLRAVITYIEPDERELREMRVEYVCAKILGKGKSIITDGCMGDPAHNLYIIPNAVIEVCFNYGKKYDKENRICLDPVEIGEPDYPIVKLPVNGQENLPPEGTGGGSMVGSVEEITEETIKKTYESVQTILQNTVDIKAGNVKRTLQLPDIMSKLCLVELGSNPEIDDPVIKKYVESGENVNTFMVVKQEYSDKYGSDYVDENGYTASYVEGLTVEDGYKCFDFSAGKITYTYKAENCRPVSPREIVCERYYFGEP